ncbi:MAG: UDP-N-acetylmuramate dehydrogenase [Candidatus Colwellbacteria bacterium]|nr:UDP-N-acetylmuramate dehydrogenase [Candidatus Colwellbacteria bacterium]
MMFEQGVDLKKFSNYKIGGPAKFLKRARTVEEVIGTLQWARENKVPLYILGGGTNILWSDKGFDGLVLKPEFNSIKVDGNFITAGASVPMPTLVQAAVGRGLKGLEWAGGLPGTFGGAIYGNAGAFGGEMKDTIRKVISLDMQSLELIERSNPECQFRYRTSVFKNKGKEIILQAMIELTPGVKRVLYESMMAKVNYRKRRHPIEYPNIGSIFKNVPVGDLDKELVEPHRLVVKTDPFPVIPAAYLIDAAGLRGASCGGAMISPRHPNFIVNVLDAKASDVLALIKLMKEKVKEKFKIQLEEEVRIIK